MIDRFNTHYNTKRTTNIVPLAGTIPATTKTLAPIISTVKMVKGYTLSIEIDTMQKVLMPEQLLDILEASLCKHTIVYGGDRSLILANTVDSYQHNGRFLTKTVQSYALKVPADVVKNLEHYFQMDLHQYLQAYLAA